MIKTFHEAVMGRRSIYGISNESTVSEKQIQEVIEHAVKYTPSAFNSQSARVIILYGEQHEKLWDITKEALREIVSPRDFASTEERINSFRAGYGSVLFYEDENVIKGLQQQFETYKDNFPIWAQQSNGMLQYVVWTSLELEGLGASLQHYNELIEEKVRSEYEVPQNWKLIAQMPFGKPTAPPDEKDFQPLDERVKVFK